MNGQTDAAAVDFLAKFTDLVIWLSFQKEGATNPASTRGTSSPSDSSTEEAVWLDVAHALDGYMLMAMSTSFTLSKHVRPAVDLPGNLVSIDDSAGALPELAPSAAAASPIQDTQRSPTPPEKGAQHQAPDPQPSLPDRTCPNSTRGPETAPPSIQPPPSNFTAGDPSCPRTHNVPVALITSASAVEASGAEAVADRNAPTDETVVNPLCAIAPQHDASWDLPSISASLCNGKALVPVMGTFDNPPRQLNRSTSEELQQERAPPCRFTSVPSLDILNIGQPTITPLALKLAPALLPNRPPQFPVVEISYTKSHVSSMPKNEALLSPPRKKRKQLTTLSNASGNVLSRSDSEDPPVLAPLKKRHACTLAAPKAPVAPHTSNLKKEGGKRPAPNAARVFALF